MIFNESGGTSLNFKVIGGVTEPTNPKENTIWVNTDKKLTSWHFGAEEPDVYNIQPMVPGDPWNLVAPHSLQEGDIINFTIPATVSGTFEAIRICDPVTNKQYCVRESSGSVVAAWPVGTKVGVRISNVRHQVGDWGGQGTAFLMASGSYYHEEGTVWITTGTSSTAPFNALKKNGIMVYPLSAKQYISGAFVNVTAKSHRNDEWVEWVEYVFRAGNGLSGEAKTWHEDRASISINNEAISVSYTAQSTGFTSVAKGEPIDVSNYSVLCIEATTTETHASTYAQRFGLTKNAHSSGYGSLNWAAEKKFTANNTKTVYRLDISNLTGEYYLWFTWGAAKSTIYNVWFELGA